MTEAAPPAPQVELSRSSQNPLPPPPLPRYGRTVNTSFSASRRRSTFRESPNVERPSDRNQTLSRQSNPPAASIMKREENSQQRFAETSISSVGKSPNYFFKMRTSSPNSSDTDRTPSDSQKFCQRSTLVKGRKHTQCTNSTEPPDFGDPFDKDVKEIEAIFYVRVGHLANKPHVALSLDNLRDRNPWKRRLVRVIIDPTNENAASIEFYGIKQDKTAKVGADQFVVKGLWRELSLRQLHVVRRETLPDNEALTFPISEEEQRPAVGNVVFVEEAIPSGGLLEYRSGQLLLQLTFDCSETSLQLEVCCNSAIERDLWHEWFSNYIVHCERKDLKAPEPPPESTIFQATFDLHPQDGVNLLINNFMSGGKLDEEEEATEELVLDFANPPHKGIVQLMTGADKFAKRKLSCPAKGFLTLSGTGFDARVSVTISLIDALVNTEAPCTTRIFIRPTPDCVTDFRATHNDVWPFYLVDDKIELRAGSTPKRDQFIEWLIFIKGQPQDREVTYPYEKDTKQKVVATTLLVPFAQLLTPDATMMTGNRSATEDEEPTLLADVTESYLKCLSGNTPLAVDNDSKRVLFTTADHETDVHPFTAEVDADWTRGGLIDKPPASFVWAEYNEIGDTPHPSTSFQARLITMDLSVEPPRFYVLQGRGLSDVSIELRSSDITLVTFYSGMYGNAGFTLHCLPLGVEVNVVLQHLVDRPKWHSVFLTVGIQVSRQSREEVNAEFLKGQLEMDYEFEERNDEPLAPWCLLCGERSVICVITGIVHPAFIDRLELRQRRCMEQGLTVSHILDELPAKEMPMDLDPDVVLRKAYRALDNAAKAFDGVFL